LRRRGYRDNEINVLMSETTRATYYSEREQGKLSAGSKVGEGAAVGGAVGTAVGAGIAAVLALGTTVAIPGVGIIAGPIVAALAGGGAGAVAGGIVGALVGLGIPESNVSAYEKILREGGVAIGVAPHSSNDASEIKEEFEELGGENIVTA